MSLGPSLKITNTSVKICHVVNPKRKSDNVTSNFAQEFPRHECQIFYAQYRRRF